jgi:hypothetical protein
MSLPLTLRDGEWYVGAAAERVGVSITARQVESFLSSSCGRLMGLVMQFLTCKLRAERGEASASRRLSIGINYREFLLPNIIHCAVHRSNPELIQVEQQRHQKVLPSEVKPACDLVVCERERHPVMI